MVAIGTGPPAETRASCPGTNLGIRGAGAGRPELARWRSSWLNSWLILRCTISICSQSTAVERSASACPGSDGSGPRERETGTSASAGGSG